MASWFTRIKVTSRNARVKANKGLTFFCKTRGEVITEGDWGSRQTVDSVSGESPGWHTGTSGAKTTESRPWNAMGTRCIIGDWDCIIYYDIYYDILCISCICFCIFTWFCIVPLFNNPCTTEQPNFLKVNFGGLLLPAWHCDTCACILYVCYTCMSNVHPKEIWGTCISCYIIAYHVVSIIVSI